MGKYRDWAEDVWNAENLLIKISVGFPIKFFYQYRVASRIRNKIEQIEGDVSILEEHREAVCDME